VCTTRAGRRVALPLGDVTRIERHARADLEQVGTRTVVRRGGGFTPVVDADALLGAAAGPAVDPARLVVLGDDSVAVAVEVGGIVDVLPAEIGAAGPEGGHAVGLGGRAAELLDRARALSLGTA
jgi:two-component system chemotaxis sensor kinase CheA